MEEVYIVFTVFIDALIICFNPYIIKNIINIVSTTDVNKENLLNKLYFPIILFTISYILMEIIWRIHGYIIQIRMVPNFRKNILDFNLDKRGCKLKSV
ncbi:MAG: hypothetical protein GY823_06940 [Flavobacteriaceae bacterium]|nr:hypothetical protein [Flavobacteriaceae bacterium]